MSENLADNRICLIIDKNRVLKKMTLNVVFNFFQYRLFKTFRFFIPRLMNSEEKIALLHNLQRYSAHRSIEIANSNVQQLNLLHDCYVKNAQIKNLTAENLKYSVFSQNNNRYVADYQE